MGNRNRLARSKIPEFSEWLKSEGVKLLEPKGYHESMRWKAPKGWPMAIVFTRGSHESVHLTLNESAIPFFNKWLKERDQ